MKKYLFSFLLLALVAVALPSSAEIAPDQTEYAFVMTDADFTVDIEQIEEISFVEASSEVATVAVVETYALDSKYRAKKTRKPLHNRPYVQLAEALYQPPDWNTSPFYRSDKLIC